MITNRSIKHGALLLALLAASVGLLAPPLSSAATGQGERQFALARYNTNGTPDLTFHGDGKLLTSFEADYAGALAIDVQYHGPIVVAGFSGASQWP